MAALLEIEGLRTTFPTDRGDVRAVNDVSFSIQRGEVLAVVGESGSGKSVTALTATRLIPMPPARIEGGAVVLGGRDILKFSAKEMRAVLGRRIGMLFQNAFAALHPMIRLGDQLVEAIILHRNVSHYEAVKISHALLKDVGFSNPERVMQQYAFETPAGDAQRTMLALALAGQPELLIADEPTSLLDAIAQDEILTLLNEVQARTGMAVWVITHDFGVVSRVADKVVVMYAGRVVETGDASSVLGRPSHPYSSGLIASVPSSGSKGRLRQIGGEVPDLTRLPPGCSFMPRCERALARCDQDVPVLYEAGEGGRARCWLYDND